MIKLRPYQVEGVEAGMKVMTTPRKKGIVVQPTGAGKSHIIAEIVDRLNVPIIILQPSKELLKQNFSKYVKIGGKASIYCASLKEKTIKKKAYTEINGELKRCDEVSNVTYATIGSIKKEIPLILKMGVKHIIVDEIHLQSKVGSQMRTFIKQLKATNVLGLTASPLYLQGGMEGSRLVMINRSYATMFRSIVQVTQISQLVKEGYWTPLIYKVIKTDESELTLNTSGSDYTEYSQKQYYKSNNLHEQIIEEVRTLKESGRKRILIFVPSIAEANALYGMIPNSAVVHSKLKPKERDFFIDAFTNGDIPVAINVNVLATGYDNPEIDGIITTRPTSSIAVFYQQIGRGCRLHPDKKNCHITDFSGNTSRFGRVEELTFEELPYYGWGLFNGSGQLLSDYPIMTKIKPTKETLIETGKREQLEKEREVEKEKDPYVFSFGKHKTLTLQQVEKKDKGYLMWIIKQYEKGEWEFNGKSGIKMKKELFKMFSLAEPKKESTDPYDKLPF